MLTIEQLREAMRPIHAMYGSVVQQKNMLNAMRQCGLAPPERSDEDTVSSYNDVLIEAIRGEIARRESYFTEV